MQQPGKPRFAPPSGFYATLRDRVRTELVVHGRPEHGGHRIVIKTLAVSVLLLGSYALLVGWASAWWQVAILATLLASAIAMVGFNVMHDAGHGAFSKRGLVNRVMGFALDFVGGSIRLWRYKHGVLHHSYPNLAGYDDDLETGGLLRLHPSQPWRPHQRLQMIYALPMYSLLAFHWIIGDFVEFFRARVGGHRVAKPKSRDTALFLAFKLHFVGWGLVVPLFLHQWWIVVITFVAIMLVVGITTSVVFQLAHVCEQADSPAPGDPLEEWAVHQLRTTVDFAPRHRFWGLVLGGLNHQVVHHLFPRISHVHYARLQPIIAQTCADFGLRYRCYPTIWSAVAAHFRQLRTLAQPPLRAATHPANG